MLGAVDPQPLFELTDEMDAKKADFEVGQAGSTNASDISLLWPNAI